MSTKPHRRELEARRSIPKSIHSRVQSRDVPGILDAVHDQHGGRWLRYGIGEQAIWFAIADLISEGTTVFRRLSEVGVTCLTSTSQSAFKRAIEAQSAFRPALVAARPGWLEGFYVFGDGTISAPSADDREVIVTFEPNPKFAPRGTLQEWQDTTGPFIAGQPLISFAIGLALSGALLRFVPRGYVNPQVEIEGGPETGKSSVGVLGASVWSGNPESDCGGGESWDLTINSLDPLKLSHGDGFLFLDEGNLAGASIKERREFARQATFKVAATGGRRRLGDGVQGQHARVSMLSTTNTPLADLIEGGAGEREAVQSRRITLRIAPNTPHGVFARLPEGYESAVKASEAMVAVADRYWGTAGREFIRRLVREVERDEMRLRAIVARNLDLFRSRNRMPSGAARVQKTFALVAVTAAPGPALENHPRVVGLARRSGRGGRAGRSGRRRASC